MEYKRCRLKIYSQKGKEKHENFTGIDVGGERGYK